MKRVFAATLAIACMASGQLSAQSVAGGTVGSQATFGRALGIVGTDVLVGEPNSETKAGMVFVYRKVAGKWAEASALSARDARNSDGFGNTIATAGNTMLVGAARTDENKGAAYVFQRAANGAWTEVAKLSASDGASAEAYASAIAISVDVASR